MKREEHETTISWDYATNTIRVYTTRESVLKKFTKRLGEGYVTDINRLGETVSFTVPMNACRDPGSVAKLLNPDEKTPMTEDQKRQRFGDKYSGETTQE